MMARHRVVAPRIADEQRPGSRERPALPSPEVARLCALLQCLRDKRQRPTCGVPPRVIDQDIARVEDAIRRLHRPERARARARPSPLLPAEHVSGCPNILSRIILGTAFDAKEGGTARLHARLIGGCACAGSTPSPQRQQRKPAEDKDVDQLERASWPPEWLEWSSSSPPASDAGPRGTPTAIAPPEKENRPRSARVRRAPKSGGAPQPGSVDCPRRVRSTAGVKVVRFDGAAVGPWTPPPSPEPATISVAVVGGTEVPVRRCAPQRSPQQRERSERAEEEEEGEELRSEFEAFLAKQWS